MIRAACFALTLLTAIAAAAADDLEGLWSSETHFALLRGELEVTRDGAQWRATIADAATTAAVDGASVRLAFPKNRGQFRGTLSADGKVIDGFWMQPAGENQDDSDTGGSGQPFATPAILRRVRAGVWRGTVAPLHEKFSLYLKVFTNENGVLVGTFRNPDQNAIGGAPRFRVEHKGDDVRFTIGEAPEIINIDAKLVSPDRMRVFWREINRNLELVRRTPEQVPAFFPRPSGEPKYVYRKPPALGDGWRTARASEAGLDEAKLAALIQGLIDSDPAGRRPSLIHSLLVAHRGKLVLEEYFYGYDRETPHDLRSAGKTFSSILLGSAMMRGSKLSPESHIYDVMAGLGPFANPDPRKAQITLAQLMTHTAGLACNDNDEKSPGNEETMWKQRGQPNFWKYTLDLPMAHDPGTRYAYCSANVNLVGGALTVGTKTWLPELFDRRIARPLQFSRYHWNLTPAGDGYLGGGAYIRPRDLLKVGQTFLDGGVWNGKRIVDAAWVKRSTAPYADINPTTTGLSKEEFGNFYGEGRDGYAWHLGQLTAGGRSYGDYGASGNGGQLLIVVPELDLAVVITGGNYMWGGVWSRWGQDIIGGAIIPAIR